MMRKTLLSLLLLVATLASAQELRFAYFDYQAVLTSMPDYQKAQAQLATIRAQYDAETRRSEDDFSQKYGEFLDGQRDFAPSIFRKRQAELQELLDKNIAFKKETEALLADAEREALAPVRQRLNDAIQKAGQDGAYAFILNGTTEQLPYVDATKGTDITEQLKAALK